MFLVSPLTAQFITCWGPWSFTGRDSNDQGAHSLLLCVFVEFKTKIIVFALLHIHTVIIDCVAFFPYSVILSNYYSKLATSGFQSLQSLRLHLHLNTSNERDCGDEQKACFWTNTTTDLRGSEHSDTSKACGEPGDASSCATLYYNVYIPSRRHDCLAQHHPIDLGQGVVD